MRHNFVNDIGDYAKYALLRALCASAQPPVHLGVIWYLTEHAEYNNDGRKRSHLFTAGWENLDPELLVTLRRIENGLQGQDQLSLSLIETAGILPLDTSYFAEPIPRAAGTARQRSSDRAAWFERARTAVAHCDLVFVDPDNGLEVRSVPVTSPQSGKYTMAAEVSALLDSGAVVVLYQHGDRTPWSVQRQRVCAQLAAGTVHKLAIRTLRFGAFGARAFFCITSNQRSSEVVERGLDELSRRVAAWDKANYVLIE